MLYKGRYDNKQLDILVYQTNLEAKITWDDEEISIAEAIELAKQLLLIAGVKTGKDNTVMK